MSPACWVRLSGLLGINPVLFCPRGGFFFFLLFFLVAGLVNLILAIRRCLTLLWAALIRYGLQLWCDNFEDCVSEFLRLFPPEPS